MSILQNSPLRFMDIDVARYLYETYFTRICNKKQIVSELHNHLHQYLTTRKLNDINDFSMKRIGGFPTSIEIDSLAKCISNKYSRYRRSIYNNIYIESYWRAQTYRNEVYHHHKLLNKN